MSIHRNVVNINVLANDTIFTICTYLLDGDLCSVAKVDKRLNNIVNNIFLNRAYEFGLNKIEKRSDKKNEKISWKQNVQQAKKHLSDLYNMVAILSGKELTYCPCKSPGFEEAIFLRSIVVYHKKPSEDQGQEIKKIDPPPTQSTIKNSTKEYKACIKTILTKSIKKHLENNLRREVSLCKKISMWTKSSEKIVENFEIIFY